MGSLLASLFTFFIGNLAARVLTGAGMAVITVAWLAPLIQDKILYAASQLNGIGQAVGTFIALSGIFTGLGFILSAILARVAIMAAKNIMGVMKK